MDDSRLRKRKQKNDDRCFFYSFMFALTAVLIIFAEMILLWSGAVLPDPSIYAPANVAWILFFFFIFMALFCCPVLRRALADKCACFRIEIE